MNEAESTDWRRLLTPAERAAMLGDIARVSLAAGTALFPEQPWADLEVTTSALIAPKSPVEQLGFVEYLLPLLTQSLAQIAHSPLTTAAACIHTVRPELARRVTTAAWMTYARHSQSRRLLDETVTVLSLDTPENRAIKSFVAILKRDCRAIALIAEAEEEPEVSARAVCCLRQLTRMLGENWWEEVRATGGDWTHPPTQRDSLRPEYACIARERIRYRKNFRFDWTQPLLTLPPRETWRVYELWCLLTVFQALRDLGWEVRQSQDFFAVRAGRLITTLEIGARSRVVLKSASGQTIVLTYNQSFAEGFESLSHTMQPDISLSDGERVWILDAKFKAYAEPGEEGGDINQMHAYRDAIIGRHGRNVACAWCLYVGLAQTQNRPLLTFQRGAEAPVGALCLRPGAPETVLTLLELLKLWLPRSESKPEPQRSP